MNKLVARLGAMLDTGARVPTALGLAPLLPLLVFAGLIAVDLPAPFDREAAVGLAVAYAALLLSFLGGVRWGMAMRFAMGRRETAMLAFSLIPLLVGWLGLFLPAGPALGLLAVAFAGQGAWDVWAVEAGQGPPWYARLRVQFTLAVTVLLGVSLMVLGG